MRAIFFLLASRLMALELTGFLGALADIFGVGKPRRVTSAVALATNRG